MGLSGISKSTVSKLCKDIDERVTAFLDRPLEGHPANRQTATEIWTCVRFPGEAWRVSAIQQTGCSTGAEPRRAGGFCLPPFFMHGPASSRAQELRHVQQDQLVAVGLEEAAAGAERQVVVVADDDAAA